MAKAAWPMVCIPKCEGGLGVLNIQTQNEALLLKHLDKFFNKREMPWGMINMRLVMMDKDSHHGPRE